MRIDVITLFPEFFDKQIEHSIVGRAAGTGKVKILTHNLRDWATDKYGTVDDHPYGGGPGMVLKVDVLHRAIEEVKSKGDRGKVILLTPQGQRYKQIVARELSKEKRLILICGHYEGYDERIREYVDLELSIGDYILTGGEIAAEVVIDSVTRLVPGVLGDDTSSLEESFNEGKLEYPQYTRPKEFEGKEVPEVLLNGNHKEIKDWREKEAHERTTRRRPDLLRE